MPKNKLNRSRKSPGVPSSPRSPNDVRALLAQAPRWRVRWHGAQTPAPLVDRAPDATETFHVFDDYVALCDGCSTRTSHDLFVSISPATAVAVRGEAPKKVRGHSVCRSCRHFADRWEDSDVVARAVRDVEPTT